MMGGQNDASFLRMIWTGRNEFRKSPRIGDGNQTPPPAADQANTAKFSQTFLMLRIVSVELRISDFGFRPSDFGLRISAFDFRSSDFPSFSIISHPIFKKPFGLIRSSRLNEAV
jgi:hypothetical protein